MKRTERRLQGKSCFELTEEAVHLLRTAPAAALALYYLGSLPFVLGFLYFWMEMGRSAFAEGHLPGRSLAVAVLFLWMKFWQAVFADHLRAALADVPAPRLGWGYCRRVAFTQTALQWTGLFLVPLSLVLTVPYAWVYALCQNLTAQGGSEAPNLRESLRRAWRQAKLWPGQNHLFQLVVNGFGLVVFVNWCLVGFALPQLLKMCSGVESVFTRNPESLFNTTFFTAMLGLSYLCVDPIVKAGYVLRCYYGESLKSGEDLKAELRHAAPVAARVAGLAAIVLLLGVCASGVLELRCEGTPGNSLRYFGPAEIGPPPNPLTPALSQRERENRRRSFRTPDAPEHVDAQPPIHPLPLGEGRGEGNSATLLAAGGLSLYDRSPGELSAILLASAAATPEQAEAPSSAGSSSGASSSLSPPELDQTIREVVQQDKYVWRAPREGAAKPETEQPGLIGRFFDGVSETLRNWTDAVKDFFRKLFAGRPGNAGPQRSGSVSAPDLRPLLWLLLVVVAAALTLLLFRAWSRRAQRFAPVASEPVQPAEPDLKDESIGAEHLPEDGWMKLARELWERGELRLALRAFYFSSLAHLAGCNLISLARFKSNHDYELELGRRAHSFPEMLTLFGENVSVFDRTWYGLHEISGELLTRFASNVERLKSGGGA